MEQMNPSIISQFLADIELRGLSHWTEDRYRWNISLYAKWCNENGFDPTKGREEDILAYLAHLRKKGLRPSSLRQVFSSLSSYFEFLEERGQIQKNPIPRIKKRYLKSYKEEIQSRQIISIEDASRMVNATIDSRDKAILLVLFKTGIRRNELISLDLSDASLEDMTLTLKPTPKRSNRLVFFDEECCRALSRWLKARENRFKIDGETALFTNYKGRRLKGTGLANLVNLAAMRIGLHDPKSKKMEDHFSPHSARHWNTTYLLRAGMKREYVQWLRGDAIKEAIDIYFHVDPKDVQEEYLACIPQLGI